MKKNFKRLVALGLALTSLATTSAFAASSMKLTGSVGSLKMSIKLPTSGALLINPYAKEQISSATKASGGKSFAIQNEAAATGDEAVAYTISFAGYSLTAKSVDEENDAISVKAKPASGDAFQSTSTKKEIIMQMQINKSDDIPADNTAFATAITATGGVSVDMVKLSEVDYDPSANADSDAASYTKVTSTGVKIEPQKYLLFRVTGSMNPAANWQTGDTITATPIFNILPGAPTEAA